MDSAINGGYSALNQANTQATLSQIYQQIQHTQQNAQLTLQQNEMKHQEDMSKLVNENQRAINDQRQEVVGSRAKSQMKQLGNWTKIITSGGGG